MQNNQNPDDNQLCIMTWWDMEEEKKKQQKKIPISLPIQFIYMVSYMSIWSPSSLHWVYLYTRAAESMQQHIYVLHLMITHTLTDTFLWIINSFRIFSVNSSIDCSKWHPKGRSLGTGRCVSQPEICQTMANWLFFSFFFFFLRRSKSRWCSARTPNVK